MLGEREERNSSYINDLTKKVWGPALAMDHPEGGRVWIRPPRISEFSLLHHLLITEISPKAASMETMVSVYRHNSDSFWVIEHAPIGRSASQVVGFYGFLLLTEEGRDALEAGTLDRRNPPLVLLAPFGEKPGAVYLWGVVARRIAKRINPLIDRAMGLLYLGVDVYTAASTPGGVKAGTQRGFSSVDTGRNRIGGLMKLSAHQEKAA
jgi:hypothetical protein